jgi:probable F420-dependent oxidoreductase
MTAASPPIRLRPFRFSTPLGEDVVDRRSLRERARLLEDLGYATATVPDHFDRQLGPIATLMAIAETTSTIRVASLVLSNDYRHPAVLAKELATVDLLTEGRLEVGLGAGWKTIDYEQSGIPHDPASTRIERMGEAIKVIKGLWGPEPVDFEGDHYRIRGMVGTPRPHQRPHPPLMIGGGGRKVLQLAAREADIVAFNPAMVSGRIDETTGATATPAETEKRLAWIREAAGDRFDGIELHVRLQLAIVVDDADPLYDALAGGFGLTPDEARGTPYAVAGPPEAIIDALLERRERYGFSYIGVPAEAAEAMGPVVAKLAGT